MWTQVVLRCCAQPAWQPGTLVQYADWGSVSIKFYEDERHCSQRPADNWTKDGWRGFLDDLAPCTRAVEIGRLFAWRRRVQYERLRIDRRPIVQRPLQSLYTVTTSSPSAAESIRVDVVHWSVIVT